MIKPRVEQLRRGMAKAKSLPLLAKASAAEQLLGEAVEILAMMADEHQAMHNRLHILEVKTHAAKTE